MDIYTVDAFTNKPFSGNPAAVCVLRRDQVPLDPSVMQAIAAEMNISETAFVSTCDGGDFDSSSEFDLKWFTPKCEVNLCGHATLATAAVIFHSLGNSNMELRFSTLSGVLKAFRTGDHISLDLPLAQYEEEDPSAFSELITAVIGPYVQLVDCQYSVSTKKLLLRLDDATSQETLESFKPNPRLMLEAHGGKVKGVIVTLKGLGKYDFVSRYFAPWVGIPEDPVTGSAHTVLGPYWSTHLHKKELKARQCSPRGGDLLIRVEKERVIVAGDAFIVMEGRLRL